MGAGGSFNYRLDVKKRAFNNKVAAEKFVEDPVIQQKRKQAADFRGNRQLSLPILQMKVPEGPPCRRPLRTQQSIKAMSLRNRSRHENSYRIQKELASSLVSLHKQNYNGDKIMPTKARTHERIDSILSTLDIVNNHYFSTREMKASDEKPVKAETFMILQTARTEAKMAALPPTIKTGFGLHKKRPPALKLIQDDSDWIQVEDEEGGELILSPRAAKAANLKGSQENEKSYMFTQSGTIFVEGFLEGIGKEGIVGTKRPLSSNRGPKLPMRDRLVLLCKLGHGASGVVYKALDLIDMRLVALKMISVFEHGKRRQMVRELSALFQVLRQKKLDFKKIQSGGKLKGVRSQFSLRSIAENTGPKQRSKKHGISDKDSITPSPSPSPSPSSPLGILEFSSSSTAGTTFSSSSGSSSFALNSDDSVSRNSRKAELNLLETVKEYESEKTISQSVDSLCSTPSSRERRSSRLRNMSKLEEHDQDTDEYGLKIYREPENFEYKDDDDEDDDDTVNDKGSDKQSRMPKSSDYKEDKDDVDDSGLEKFFVKPASEFIVDFYDAFSNIDDGGVALMMEYMDGGSLQDIVDDGGCDDEITLSNIAVQALIGLAFLHSCGQLHRDLKPGNFLISHRGDVKVADLGILCQLDERRAPDPDKDKDKDKTNDVADQKASRRPSGSEMSSMRTRGGCESLQQTMCLSDNGEGSESDESPSPRRSAEDSPIPHTKTFVGTVTFMSPERIDGREYSYPSDVWAFGLSLMTLALGTLPIDTQGGYWTILHCIRDSEPPTLPNDGKFSEDFRDFLSSCLQKDPKSRLTCNQLLLHPFLRKAVPEECGIGTLSSISGKNKIRQQEAENEAKEVQSRGISELHSILAALHLHFERIQLGISPKSGLQISETSQNHPFFSGLKSARLEEFLRQFLLGSGIVVEEGNEVERGAETVLEPNCTPAPQPLCNGQYDDENKLNTLAKQLHLTPNDIKDEIRSFCEKLYTGSLSKKKSDKAPRRFSRVPTPKATHSGIRGDCK